MKVIAKMMCQSVGRQFCGRSNGVDQFQEVVRLSGAFVPGQEYMLEFSPAPPQAP